MTSTRLARCFVLSLSTLALTFAAACGSDSTDDPPANTGDQDAAAQQESSVPEQDAAPDAPVEEDATPDAAEEAAAQDAADEGSTVAKCKNEVDLSTQQLPCDCYGTIVNSVEEAMPSCTLTVVCCPGIPGLKCE